jgi:hypothetical protein
MEEFAQRDASSRRRLAAAHDRFASFSPEVQERIRQLHRHIETSDRRDQLRRTMEQYCRFLTSLPPYERVELQTLPPEKRLERTRQLYEEQRRHRARMEAFWAKWRAEWNRRLFPLELRPEDVEAIGRWAEQFALQHGETLLEKVSAERRERIRRELERVEKDPAQRREILAWLWFRWQVDFPGKLPPLDEKSQEELFRGLTAGTRQRLETLPAAERDRIIFRALRYWVANQLAARSWTGPPPVISEQELAVFLQQTLSPERREDLFRAEPGERMRRLWLEFVRSRWAEVPEGQPPMGMFRPGGPGGPGPFWPGMPPGVGPERPESWGGPGELSPGPPAGPGNIGPPRGARRPQQPPTSERGFSPDQPPPPGR